MAIECPTCGLLRFYGPTGLSAPQCMCLGGYQKVATPAPASHIKEPFTVQEIRERINSHDYSPEMLLQHAMLHLEQTQTCAATPAPARCANGPMGCDYPRCDCNGAGTKESNQ